MKKFNSIILSCLEQSIHEIIVNAGFNSHLGLYDGKMGISLLLHYYNRFIQNNEVEEYANHLINEVFTAIAEENSFNLIPDITNIAWTICHLTEQGFIESDLNEIFEDMDSFLWPSSESTCKFISIQNLADIGIYILKRIKIDRSKDIWYERGVFWLKEVENFILKYGLPNITILFSVLVFRRTIRKYDSQTDFEGGYLFENMTFFVQMANLFKAQCESDRYILHSFSGLPVFDSLTPSLLNINKFYLYQLLYGNITVPQYLDSGIKNIVYDQNRTLNLISSANPQNIGLNNYLGGWSWALLQYCIKEGMNH